LSKVIETWANEFSSGGAVQHADSRDRAVIYGSVITDELAEFKDRIRVGLDWKHLEHPHSEVQRFRRAAVRVPTDPESDSSASFKSADVSKMLKAGCDSGILTRIWDCIVNTRPCAKVAYS
jgi:hypothetical protein